MRTPFFFAVIGVLVLFACNKKPGGATNPPPPAAALSLNSWSVGSQSSQNTNYNVGRTAPVRFSFSAPVNRNTVAAGFSFVNASNSPVNYSVAYANNDSTVIITPSLPLEHISLYRLSLNPQLTSRNGGSLNGNYQVTLITAIDSSRKFPAISDDSLLTLVQKQTFRYFWDFAHPVSGMARERNTSGDVVTTGGTGFGIMALIVGVHRNFITRAEALTRMQKIVGFLKNNAQTFRGAFPHWMNGISGQVVPFSQKDDGADLVETSFLMQGLLTARQYFSGTDAGEATLRSDINQLWNAVQWNWFRKGNENVLYWHWSPNYGWEMNHQIRGWNEALITYVLAASSTSYAIPKIVYDNGWARNGAMRNNNSYYGIPLPLGEPYGGPLFFAHYSFLGIDPRNLSDAYANYWQQNQNHSLINHQYAKANPLNQFGYSDSTWGLTASDIPNGYTASSPTNDRGVIAPTAALASFPYTPTESMKALKFMYYVLGDKLWKEYGFVDAFSLKTPWFANSFLAIDQGPIIVMIENYRSGLLWDLFTSSPEVKAGMRSLGFTAPYL